MLSDGVAVPSTLPAIIQPGQLTGLSTDLIVAILDRIGVQSTIKLFPHVKPGDPSPSYLDSVLAGVRCYDWDSIFLLIKVI